MGYLPRFTSTPTPQICKKSDENQDSFKVKIDNHKEEVNVERVPICIPIYKTGSFEVLLKFIVPLQKIPRGQNLTTQDRLSKDLNIIISKPETKIRQTKKLLCKV